MKYFSKEWWDNGGLDETITPKYLKYLETLQNKLPVGIKKFVDEHYLHDSILNHQQVDLPNGTLTWSLITYNKEFTKKEPFDLVYIDVQLIKIISSSADDTGLGTIGYDEFEALENGIFQHRILFSSGIEIRINFKDLVCEFVRS